MYLRPMIFLFALIIISVFLFAFEVFPVDKTAMLLLVSMLILGMITPQEAISGFSNPALITILGLMILAFAVEKNGVIKLAVGYMSGLSKQTLWFVLPVFMFVTGAISAFISTTAVVIVFIKLINELHIEHGMSKSKLLLPVSFAGILGGSCTLMGTSTNLIVNAIAQDNGIAGFSFFEFTAPGLVLFVLSAILITIAAVYFLPDDTAKKLRDEYQLQDYITRFRIKEGSELIGQKLKETDLYKQEGAKLLKLRRNKFLYAYPDRNIELKEGDVLLIKTSINHMQSLTKDENIELITRSELKKVDEDDEVIFAELLVLPNSNLIGRTLERISKISFRGSIPIAIKKREKLIGSFGKKGKKIKSDGQEAKIAAGDSILVETTTSKKSNLSAINNVMFVNSFDSGTKADPIKRLLAGLILIIVIILAATGIFSILKSVLIGVFLMLVFKCVELTNAYQSINWQVIMLLACMIPIGIAMKNTGANEWVVEQLITSLSSMNPTFIVALIFLITMIASGFISNNAVAIIMTPVAIGLSTALNIPIMALLISVVFGANFSFFTPVGYQTNTIIYALGLYKFKHFLIIGGLLSLILWIVSVLLIQYFYM